MDFSTIVNSIYLNAGHLAVVCLGISVVLCLFNFKRLGIPLQRLCYFLMLNFCVEILARIFVFAFTGINNLPLLHLYTLGEFLLLSWFYKSLLNRPLAFQQHYWKLILGAGICIILNSLFLQSIYEFNTIAKTFVQIVIISYAVLYFYHLSENQLSPPTVAKSLRLVNSAIIVYYSGSLFIFMCSQVSFENLKLYKFFWLFNAVLNLIFQLLILWGIWKVVSTKIPSSS